jgi:hypothetical protein
MLLSQISRRERRWDLELDQEMENGKKKWEEDGKKCANGSSLATGISQHALLGLPDYPPPPAGRRPAAGRRRPTILFQF